MNHLLSYCHHQFILNTILSVLKTKLEFDHKIKSIPCAVKLKSKVQATIEGGVISTFKSTYTGLEQWIPSHWFGRFFQAVGSCWEGEQAGHTCWTGLAWKDGPWQGCGAGNGRDCERLSGQCWCAALCLRPQWHHTPQEMQWRWRRICKNQEHILKWAKWTDLSLSPQRNQPSLFSSWYEN